MAEITGERVGGRRDAQRNHELLVEAARELFMEQGVDAPLEEVARRAGLGIGTLYRHFATRDALVEAIVERRMGELLAIAEAALSEPEGWEGLVRSPRTNARASGRRPHAEGRPDALFAGDRAARERT